VLDWYAHQEQTLFVLGGSQIYMAFAAYIDQLIVTDIHGQFNGDVYFPKAFPMEKFQLQGANLRPKDEKNPYDFTIKTYERRDG
ncbi:dihydrofolate reductase, partial [Streptococcus suis]